MTAELMFDIKTEVSDDFADGEVGVVCYNARQLKLKTESTGFE